MRENNFKLRGIYQCPKCGFTQIAIRHLVAMEKNDIGDYLAMKCLVCEYRWQEKTVDAEDK
ncbi:MAG: hypothetical protein ACXAEN_20705 [Candidatus Thorarchaeota archaeon]